MLYSDTLKAARFSCWCNSALVTIEPLKDGSARSRSFKSWGTKAASDVMKTQTGRAATAGSGSAAFFAAARSACRSVQLYHASRAPCFGGHFLGAFLGGVFAAFLGGVFGAGEKEVGLVCLDGEIAPKAHLEDAKRRVCESGCERPSTHATHFQAGQRRTWGMRKGGWCAWIRGPTGLEAAFPGGPTAHLGVGEIRRPRAVVASLHEQADVHSDVDRVDHRAGGGVGGPGNERPSTYETHFQAGPRRTCR